MSAKQSIIYRAQDRIARAIEHGKSIKGPEVEQILSDLYDEAIGL